MPQKTSNKKTVLVLAHSAQNGGAELALQSLITSTKDDFDWHIVFPVKRPANPVAIQDVSKVSYLQLPWWCHEAHDSPQPLNKQRLLKEVRALRAMAQEADLLLTNTITIPWLGLISQQVQKPHIWYVHEFGNLDHNLTFIAGYSQSLQMIAQCSNLVITISESVRQHLSQVIPRNQIGIIHQSIDLQKLTSLPIPPAPRALTRFLCIGAIKPSKGQLIAIEAVKKLLTTQESEAHLDIIGPVANRAYYDTVQKHQTPPRVIVREGFVNAVEAFQSHDVVLMCSENEALGRVTLEALAAGKVVVGFDAPATRELLQDGRGIIYGPNTAEALAATLLDLNRLVRSIDSRAARKYVTTHYNSSRQQKDFLTHANKLLKSALPTPQSVHSLEDYLTIVETAGLFVGRQKTYRRKARHALARAVPSKLKHVIKRRVLRRPS